MKKGKVFGEKTRKDCAGIKYVQPLRRHKEKFEAAGAPWASAKFVLSNATICSDARRLILRGTVDGKGVYIECRK